MKYSLRILFLAFMVVALVTTLTMRHNDWPAIASVGLGVLLLWARCGDVVRSRIRATNQVDLTEPIDQSTDAPSGSTTSNAPMVEWILLVGLAVCFSSAVVSMMNKVVPQNVEYKAFYYRSIPPSSVAILSTVVLAIGVVPIWSFRPTHPSLVRLGVVLRSILFVAYGFSLDIVIWLTYLACKGIEQGMVDPARILGNTELLSFGSAFLKGGIGTLGIILWCFTARSVVRRVQQNVSGWFFKSWILCGFSCIATFVLWYHLLDDFPQMRAALSAIQQQPFQLNTLLVGLLFVIAFVQYCVVDRNALRENYTQANVHRESLWRNRFLGVAMTVPGFIFFIQFLLPLRRFRNFEYWTSFYVWEELVQVIPVMLLALIFLGFTFLANASLAPPRKISITFLSLMQVVVMAIVLVICIPIHFPAMLFYFDASLTLPVAW
ncbi:MAG: hypothetical protein ACK56W_13915 [Pirellula sp.]|jgi:hypothetical protein|nr:hypothetical protein [Pirellula sp.]